MENNNNFDKENTIYQDVRDLSEDLLTFIDSMDNDNDWRNKNIDYVIRLLEDLKQ